MRRRRRRELFPPDRRLQRRMVLAATLTPLAALAALFGVVAFLPGRLAIGVGIASMIGIGMAVSSARKLRGDRLLRPEESPELHATVDRLCALGDIPRPGLVVEPERQPNSWIVDAPRRAPRLHLTQGLLDVLAGPELEAVIAHELAHVANRDATVMTVVGGPGAILSQGGGKLAGTGGWWPIQAGGVLALAIGEVSRVGTNALSRYRELSADAGAAALTGRPAALASALLKVSGELHRLPAEDLRAAAGRDAFHLLPVEREGKGWAARLGRRPPFRRLGATHPDLDRRLAALERLEQRMHAARPAPRVV